MCFNQVMCLNHPFSPNTVNYSTKRVADHVFKAGLVVVVVVVVVVVGVSAERRVFHFFSNQGCFKHMICIKK